MVQNRFVYLSALLLSTTTFACGSNDPANPDGAGTDNPGTTPDTVVDNTDGSEQKWAPGTADPCEGLDTGYLNDELCLVPPAEDVGFQTHFGPSDYDNPDEVAPFLLEPGGEDVVCQYRWTPDFEGVKYTAEQHTRLREGTHHMIMWSATSDVPDAPADGAFHSDGCQNPFQYAFTTGAQAALGEKGGILDIPLPGGDPPENAGTAKLVNPHRSVAVEMHYVNTGTEAILREAWINTIYTDPSNVETLINPMFFIGTNINVPPGQSQLVVDDNCQQPPIPEGAGETEVRILGMTGHAHANTTRISAWINRAATGEQEKIYEAYDWAEPINAQFSSVHVNPPMGDGITDGAHTGILTMQPGDTFGWECMVENQTDVTLVFGNKAYTAEMCNVFGFMVPGDGGMWACFY